MKIVLDPVCWPRKLHLSGSNAAPLVILSRAMLQRSGRSPRGQAFNLRSFLWTRRSAQHPEMFRFAQHDRSTNSIRKARQNALLHRVGKRRIVRRPSQATKLGVAYTFVGVAAFAGLLVFSGRRERSIQPLGKPAVAFALQKRLVVNHVVNLCGRLCFSV